LVKKLTSLENMNPLQLKASNPEISTWVSASAGTGKTKILTDRVLRLLLSNAAFNKILCLTFTNAAAGEMKERIVNSLTKWSKLKDLELKEELHKTLGRNGTMPELAKAKQLYKLSHLWCQPSTEYICQHPV
jgi:ATP-dependent helicase/nuclease subunit A